MPAAEDEMITGIHAILYSQHADALRTFLGETLGLCSVDAGGGWPIYGLHEPRHPLSLQS